MIAATASGFPTLSACDEPSPQLRLASRGGNYVSRLCYLCDAKDSSARSIRHQASRLSAPYEFFNRVHRQVSVVLAKKIAHLKQSGTTVDVHHREFGFLSRTLTSVHSSHGRILKTLIETRRGVA